MKKHIVKQPFMCREGQFEKGQHTLCIGIEVQALKKAKTYQVYIGKNKKVSYKVSYAKALEIVAAYGDNARWKRNGKDVFILPIFAFKKLEEKETKPVSKFKLAVLRSRWREAKENGNWALCKVIEKEAEELTAGSSPEDILEVAKKIFK